MARRLALALACFMIAGACGGTATSPTIAPLAAGRYLVSISAPDYRGVGTQIVPGCLGAGYANVGYLMLYGTVTEEAGVSRLRPATAADGDFEMRFTGTRQTPLVSGSLTGTVGGLFLNTAMPPVGAIYDARATIRGATPGSTVPVSATITSGAFAVTDFTIDGTVIVGNSAGLSITCSPGTVSIHLSRSF